MFERRSRSLCSNVRELVVVQIADEAAGEPISSGAGRIEAADQVHQRGFAGTEGPMIATYSLCESRGQPRSRRALVRRPFRKLWRDLRFDYDARADQVFAYDSADVVSRGMRSPRAFGFRVSCSIFVFFGAVLSTFTLDSGFRVRRAL